VTNTPLPVSVTNVSTQYSRTPVAICMSIACTPGYYTVPSDQRLVIETISYGATGCPPGLGVAMDLVVGAGHLLLTANNSSSATDFVSTVQNVRVVVDHDQTLSPVAGEVQGCTGAAQLWLYGYLVGVNSPSLAP
jgi:hypothetical protein